MAKGSIAKENVNRILQSAFGDKYIGEFDKKTYVWADDGGQMVQIAIAMTCPKNPVGSIEVNTSNRIDFENENMVIAPVIDYGNNPAYTPTEEFYSAEITPEERETVNELLKALNL